MNPARKAKRTVALILEALEDRTVPTLVGNQLFPADNPWNQKITNAPLASNSAAIINNITTKYGNGRLHPDFGQDYYDSSDLYGIPYNIVHGNSLARTSVVIDAYPDESDLFAAPLPSSVVLEGDFQNGPRVGVDNRGDSHLLLYDVDNNVAYEFYRMSRPSENSDGKWHADQETVWDMKTNSFRTIGYTSADAAGLSLLVGLVRPDEGLPVSQGGQGVINHAIRFTLQNSIILNQFIYPASHVANSGSNTAVQPPMGARFRLNANVDISQLNPQSRIIAQAMKDYGMIVADNGSNFFFSGASYSVDASNQQTLTWNDDDIQDSLHGLKSLHFSNFEVVDLTPQVSDLSLHTGPAGSAVTVTGRNFTGAAGHTLVLFGNTPATSVNVVNDTTITCVAPAGLSGTVDVRVQSGVTTANNPQNYKGTIFGYGISAVNTNDRFTFGSGTTNQAPTVVNPAAASSNPVTGFSVNLSVLGADDAGEANLKYTWSSTGPAAVTYSSNGSNTSKNTSVTFTQPGNYTFTVTITDAPGLSVTSSTSVTVNAPNQAPTVVTAAGATSNPVTGNSVGLFVLGADDGGEGNLKYTWAGTGPGTVSYTSNGSNSSKNTTATFSQPGVYSFVVTIADAQGLSATSSVSVTVNAPNQAPTVVTAAGATSNPVTGNSVGLFVLGADDGGEGNLKYTWAGTGPGTVSYTSNGNNSSKNTTATFSQPGVYSFVVTIADAQGLSATSSVSVTVNALNQPPTIVNAASASANPVNGNKVNLNVLGSDDGGEANLKYTWTSTGPAGVTFTSNANNAAKNTIATFSTSGVYTFLVTVTDAQGQSASSSVSVTVNMITNKPPTISKPAKASTSAVTGKSVSLSALGADDGGAAKLTYNWTSDGPVGVIFSRNGTNLAQTTIASFAAAGVYTFTVTITDEGGLSTTSTVKVIVKQTLSSLVVTPSSSTVKLQETVQFKTTAYDQFSNALTTQPTITWWLVGYGKLTSKGLYTAPRTKAGLFTIVATVGSFRGSAKVTVIK